MNYRVTRFPESTLFAGKEMHPAVLLVLLAAVATLVRRRLCGPNDEVLRETIVCILLRPERGVEKQLLEAATQPCRVRVVSVESERERAAERVYERYLLLAGRDALFAKGWDVALIGELEACGKRDAVLTALPPPADGSVRGTYLRLNKAGTELKTSYFARRPLRPVPSPLWCAEFSFSRGRVPLPREADGGATLWAAGCSFLAPCETYVWSDTPEAAVRIQPCERERASIAFPRRKSEFGAVAGVTKQGATRRGRRGLSHDPSDAELRSKK